MTLKEQKILMEEPYIFADNLISYYFFVSFYTKLVGCSYFILCGISRFLLKDEVLMKAPRFSFMPFIHVYFSFSQTNGHFGFKIALRILRKYGGGAMIFTRSFFLCKRIVEICGHENKLTMVILT